MRLIRYAAVGSAIIVSSQVQAQVAPPPTSVPSVPTMPLPEYRSMDERMTDFERMSHDINRRAPGATRATTPIPAHPDDVIPGIDVRDSRGVVMAKVESVGMAFATLSSPLGRIEVEFESFAKNNKGILINMTKKKFDSLVDATSGSK